ncbi:MAG: hypothetical protein FWC55_02390 [Firmicutes bacterium]|nr:hypothetical protein [Bacillota bacterium]
MTGLPCHGVGYFGVNHQSFGDGLEDGHDRPAGSVWTDIWGTTWRKENDGLMGFHIGNPLADPKSLASYKWPDPDDERICGKIYEQAEAFDRDGGAFLCGANRDTLWEKAYMLVGMENMMEYFYSEPEYAGEILHRIMDFQLGIAGHYANAGIELAALGDDLGTQCGPLLGPEIFGEFLLPEYRRLFGFYKSRNILINFHSCGHIEPLLEDFIALGADVLNPVQATANDLRRVREITEGKMALAGGVSTGLIMEGPTERIRRTVKDTIYLLGRNGGYFCQPDQGMPFPRENIEAFYQAVEEYGRYPLNT